MKRFLLPLVAVLALTFALFSVVRTQSIRKPEPPPAPPPVTPFRDAVAAVGLVEANTENIAIGTHLSGVVERRYVTVGQAVKAGEPLFKLDDRHLKALLFARQAEFHLARARVKTAEATLGDATQQLRFAKGVANPRAISAEELTRRSSAVSIAAAQLEEAKAAITVAEAGVRTVQTEIERSLVRSPVDGEVLQVKLRAGEFAVAGATPTPLILLGNVKPLHLRVDIDEHAAWRVRPEAKAYAFVRGHSGLKAELEFVRFEPFILPKKSLTGDSTERVDTRVLQAIYRLERGELPIYVGQQMDVFIEANVTAASSPAENTGPSDVELAAQGEPQ
jgi:HlyD family secretion protein